MIITVAVAKGGVGKSTLVRALASVATHQGHNVFVIDADERKNIERWSMLLDRFGNRPENLEIVAVTAPTEILALAQDTGGMPVRETRDQRANAVADLEREVRGGGAHQLMDVLDGRLAVEATGLLVLAHRGKSTAPVPGPGSAP